MEKAKLIGVWIFAVIALTTMVHLYTYHVLNTAPQENANRVNATVGAVCDWARGVNTASAYQACGAAQNESMTEYLCAKDEPNTCWVEDKR